MKIANGNILNSCISCVEYSKYFCLETPKAHDDLQWQQAPAVKSTWKVGDTERQYLAWLYEHIPCHEGHTCVSDEWEERLMKLIFFPICPSAESHLSSNFLSVF